MGPFAFSLPLAFLMSCFGVSSCAGRAAPIAHPEPGADSWAEVRSEHFVLRTDLPVDEARAASAQLEAIFAALQDLSFASSDRPRLQIDLVLFRSGEEAAGFLPTRFVGQFHLHGWHDFERRPTAVLGGALDRGTTETLQHEITHFFVHYYYPQAPPWLNEGLARYFETMSLEDDTVVVGRQPGRELFTTDENSQAPGLVPVSQAVEPGVLHRMLPGEFYGDLSLDPSTPEGKREARAMSAHYVSAWCLVDLLLTDPKYQAAFTEYLKRIRIGDPDEAAWSKTMGRFPPDSLVRDYRAMLMPGHVAVVRTRWSAPPYAPLGVRTMSRASVHALWAQARPETEDGKLAARRDLADARAASDFDPSDPDFALIAAYRKLSDEGPGAAAESLQPALSRHPDDPRLWSALGWLTLKSGGAHCLSAEDGKRLDSIASRLDPIAASAAQLDLLAHASAKSAKLDDALAFEKRALELDPSCVDCRAEAANVLYDMRRFREALATAQLAQGLAGEGTPSPGLSTLIEKAGRRLDEDAAASRGPRSAALVDSGSGEHPGNGRLPPEVIQKVVRAGFPRLRECYEDGLRTQCDLRGRVTTKFVIDTTGAVALTDDGGSDLPDPRVVDCVVRSFAGMHFPRPEGGAVTVVYPIMFSPTD
jgi:tetratricopeptide (TPR) repeat protein